jgi:hypothetical protein
VVFIDLNLLFLFQAAVVAAIQSAQAAAAAAAANGVVVQLDQQNANVRNKQTNEQIITKKVANKLRI